MKQLIAAQQGFYDRAGRAPPRAFQTVLEKKPERFHPTKQRDRKSQRRVFEEIAAQWLYYVDDAHQCPEAHLEVFAANGAHLGTADIDKGDLRPEIRVNGRVIRL